MEANQGNKLPSATKIDDIKTWQSSTLTKHHIETSLFGMRTWREAAASMASHTPNLECQMYETRYPDVDMAVMIQVKNITDVGACVSVLEYNNIKGMILFS
ncbi:hypothetical protein FF1_029200 [Malus domestica]